MNTKQSITIALAITLGLGIFTALALFVRSVVRTEQMAKENRAAIANIVQFLKDKYPNSQAQ